MLHAISLPATVTVTAAGGFLRDIRYFAEFQ